MSNPRIGTRVKHVRDNQTGVVVEYIDDDHRCMGIRVDSAGEGYDENGWEITYQAGMVVYNVPWDWKPILPSGHRSGDYSYTELMDRCRAGEVECV